MSRQAGLCRLACAVAFGAVLALPLSADGKKVGARSAEAGFHPGKPPAGLSAEATAALARIERWKCDREHAATACADGRVLYASALDGKARAARVAMIEKLCAASDALLPAPARKADPDAPKAEWGTLHEPERGALLLVEAADSADYAALVDALKLGVADEPALAHLGAWLEPQRDQPGFVCEETLTAAWQSAPPGIEADTVWRNENELAHRLAHLLLYRRYGELPHWLRTAAAWHFEQLATGTIHCFPGRSGFVAVDGDHDGWQDALANEFKGRKREPLRFDEFGAWRRGSWSDVDAAHAWGTFEYLATKEPQRLSALCEALRVYRVEHAVTKHADGSWELVPGYAIPIGEQQALFERQLGSDFLARVSAFLADWKGWKDPALLSRRK
jgi:hypothetical protein